jgi:hypothetical protein
MRACARVRYLAVKQSDNYQDNAARRAIVHHWGAGGGGSHYHMSASKQFLKGVRIKAGWGGTLCGSGNVS